MVNSDEDGLWPMLFIAVVVTSPFCRTGVETVV